MSQNKKNEPQFKLNYFDIIKGVLFPNAGKPVMKSPPPAAHKPAPTAYTPPSTRSGQSNPPRPAPQPAQPAAQKPPQTPLPVPIQGDIPRPATRPASPTPTTSPVGTTSTPTTQTTSPQRAIQKPTSKSGRFTFQREKLSQAFFHVAGILSFIVNLVLIVVLIILVRELFALKALVGDHLLGGLYKNFQLMDAAHIRTTITVQDNIPIAFDLPISQQITVTLTENTIIRNAIVGVLSVPTTVTLPAGTQLPIQLNLTVPVQTTIPVTLNVPVDIPLQETELHQPFIGLQDVVRPLNDLLQPNIKTPQDLPCGLFQPVCNTFFITP